MPTGYKLTQEQFLAKAVAVHGSRYSYLQTVCIRHDNKVKIECAEHGLFEQTPNHHLAGGGCPACGRVRAAKARNYGLLDFLKKARAKHGEKYDYSQVVYTTGIGKVKITCPIHGLFEQAAQDHLAGKGCLGCKASLLGNRRRLSTVDFIANARAVHGDKYDYSQAVYTRGNEPVVIICPQHGSFKQKPSLHCKHGCPKCGLDRVGAKFDYEAFLVQAAAIHGSRFTYSGVVERGGRSLIRIGCAVHGEFKQPPYQHLKAAVACLKCAGLAKLSTQEFITRALAVHGNKYDYSRVVYRGGRNLVTIVCPQHGEFQQAPAPHVRNQQGCPACAKVPKWVDRADGRMGTLYVIRLLGGGEDFYKVGITLKDISVRLKGIPYRCQILASYSSFNVKAVADWESALHTTFAHLRYKPKLIFGGATECFSEVEPILAALPVGSKFY